MECLKSKDLGSDSPSVKWGDYIQHLAYGKHSAHGSWYGYCCWVIVERDDWPYWKVLELDDSREHFLEGRETSSEAYCLPVKTQESWQGQGQPLLEAGGGLWWTRRPWPWVQSTLTLLNVPENWPLPSWGLGRLPIWSPLVGLWESGPVGTGFTRTALLGESLLLLSHKISPGHHSVQVGT